MIDLNEFIGKPFKADGRGPDAFDCYGLAQAIAAARGFRLPDQKTPEAVAFRIALFERVVTPFTVRINVPEPWALVTFDLGRHGLHIGTLTDEPGRMIHTSQTTGAVVIQRMNRTFYDRTLLGIYRCVRLFDDQIHLAAKTA